ncbi:MAG: orotate phosphoribosyltransferase [Bacteroidales bacterium]|nr:orotate phosphoribosyltransferase [Bacteroidales bacterium]HOY37813.1 orotate phosphoribosyltransferase [Bacteroidales bacterium]HQP04193.1 orotate phosphoribosyltransferase [Bacteroidales bacterium]
MQNIAKQIAEQLLQIKAIKLDPTNHFTWASGWYSPIYCDNRKTLSFPEVRTFIRDSFVKIIGMNFGDFDVVAGVATGAIAQGALVADALKKPFVYVRSKPKDHGLENLIEGYLEKGKKVLVVEDLISTGGSSLGAVKAVRAENCEVVGMVAIFSYGFDVAKTSFENENVKLVALSNYDVLIEHAIETGYIKAEQLKTLQEWRVNPSVWKK